jgi:hypothetical protein
MRKRRHDLTAGEEAELCKLIQLGRALTTSRLMVRFQVSRGVITRLAAMSKTNIVPHETYPRSRGLTSDELSALARELSA